MWTQIGFTINDDHTNNPMGIRDRIVYSYDHHYGWKIFHGSHLTVIADEITPQEILLGEFLLCEFPCSWCYLAIWSGFI